MPFRVTITAFLACALWLLPDSLAAQGDAEVAPPEPRVRTEPGIPERSPMLHGKLSLSLREAIAMGLENNLDVEVQRFEPLIAGEDVGVAWGAYDPEWFSEFGYADTKTPTGNVLAGSSGADNVRTTRITDGVGGLRGLLPWLGAQYNVQLESDRTTTDARFQQLSPEYGAIVSASATVPLLRNLIWNEPWTRVKTTRVIYEASVEDFRRQVMDTVRDIEDAYWSLIAADEQNRVATKSLETARALLDQTQTQYEVGVVSRVEVTEAEAGVADREVNKIVTENAYRTAQDVLINRVLGPGLRGESTLEIHATDRPEDYVVYAIDVQQAVEMAFENRPELVVATREIERNEIQLKFAKNQRLPQLDFVAGYNYEGLSGRAADSEPIVIPGEPPPEPIPDTNYGDAYDNFFDPNGTRGFSFRGLFSIPIPNTAARHSVSRQDLALRRSRTEKRRLEQSIILEVRQTVRDLESAQEGIEAAERARLAAAEQLRAERIRLEYGESTPFDVLLREESLVGAESSKINALRVYRTSVTNLDRAQGTILRNRNVAIDSARAVR